MTACLVALLAVVLAAGACSKVTLPSLGFGEEKPQAPNIPLRVRVELDPSIHKAAFAYKDACGSPKLFPVGARLSRMLMTDTRKVFQELMDRDEPSLGIVADAVLRFTVERQDYDLFVPRLEAWGEYPAKATLRVRASLREAQGGQEIFSDSFKGTGKWKVVSDEDGIDCRLEGIGIPVDDALEEVSEKLVDTLRHAANIQAAAVRLLAKRQVLAGRFQQPTLSIPPSPRGAAPGMPQGLSFRVLLEDENRNRIFEGEETISLQIEVTNGGPGVAQGVTVELSGSPVLVERFETPVSLGTLQAGEGNRLTLTATLPPGVTEQQSELVVQITEASGLSPPPPKRFIAWMRPARGAGDRVEVLSVDVDHIPAVAAGPEHRNRYAVVVGIGTYRGERSPSVAYAKRDAEVVARYLQAVGGFPEANIRVLTDEYAVLSDLREAFEHWLPRHVSKDSIVLIYVVGKGLARMKTGETYLATYEGRSASRYRVYPVAKLLNTLDRLPSKGVLLFFDLSFGKKAGVLPRRLSWLDRNTGANGKAVVIASSGVATPSAQFDRGRHGLFTYHLLKGLRGGADTDKDGSVSVMELFGYLKTHVPEAARAQGQATRIPVMIPRLPVGSRLGAIPISKVPGGS